MQTNLDELQSTNGEKVGLEFLPTQNQLLSLTTSCHVLEIIVTTARRCPKRFGPPNVLGVGPKYLTQFYNSGSPSNTWQKAKFGDNQPRTFEKKETSKHQQQN